ncbi:MAG: hypothetical protein AAB885_04010, partial [Patescibacteria group bacterium]
MPGENIGGNQDYESYRNKLAIFEHKLMTPIFQDRRAFAGRLITQASVPEKRADPAIKNPNAIVIGTNSKIKILEIIPIGEKKLKCHKRSGKTANWAELVLAKCSLHERKLGFLRNGNFSFNQGA